MSKKRNRVKNSNKGKSKQKVIGIKKISNDKSYLPLACPRNESGMSVCRALRFRRGTHPI